MRLTVTRVICQAFFVGLAAFFALVTQYRYLRGYPVSAFLETDPLIALSTAITTHAVYQGLILALAVLLPALLIGRFFCGWVCPFGALQQFVAWLLPKGGLQQQVHRNRYRAVYAAKYYLLVAAIGAALVGSLQIGLLDPLCLLFRSLAVAVLPVMDLMGAPLYLRPHVHQYAWLIGLLLYATLLANLLAPRFFCRALCPLGACLGLLSRFSLGRIHRDAEACRSCDLCLVDCQGACDPHARLRAAECFVCMECVGRCPHGALRFGLLPDPAGQIAGPDLGRRRLVLAALTGVLLVGWSRRSWRAEAARPQLLRPPGSVPESDFLERCVKCGQCLRVCPTNVLQPALTEGGLEGLWTPVMKMQVGYCELNCTLCGQVCPTGAIQRISLPQKLGLKEFVPRGPVRTGTAFYDRGRCLAWGMETPCVVCQEVCPTAPKAIYTRREQVVGPPGPTVALDRPYVDPSRCIGCGICEHECPVQAPAAIRVYPAGESRSPDHGLLLGPP